MAVSVLHILCNDFQFLSHFQYYVFICSLQCKEKPKTERNSIDSRHLKKNWEAIVNQLLGTSVAEMLNQAPDMSTPRCELMVGWDKQWCARTLLTSVQWTPSTNYTETNSIPNPVLTRQFNFYQLQSEFLTNKCYNFYPLSFLFKAINTAAIL